MLNGVAGAWLSCTTNHRVGPLLPITDVTTASSSTTPTAIAGCTERLSYVNSFSLLFLFLVAYRRTDVYIPVQHFLDAAAGFEARIQWVESRDKRKNEDDDWLSHLTSAVQPINKNRVSTAFIRWHFDTVDCIATGYSVCDENEQPLKLTRTHFDIAITTSSTRSIIIARVMYSCISQ